MKNIKKIGVLGGMGPVATVKFLELVNFYAQSLYNAVQDDEYPEIVVNSVGLHDFLEIASLKSPEIFNQLKRGILDLENLGVDFIVIPCNTVHALQAELQELTNTKILSMVDLVVSEVEKLGSTKVGVVCSDWSNKTGLYRNKLIEKNVNVISSDSNQQNKLNNIIKEVMSGKPNLKGKQALLDIVSENKKNGAKLTILGCTEIPLVLKGEKIESTLDCLDVLARETVNYAYDNMA